MKKIHSLWRYMTIALCGVSTLTIFPSTDYMEHVSTPEQLSPVRDDKNVIPNVARQPVSFSTKSTSFPLLY